MNPDLDKLKPYPFERLSMLNAEVEPVGKPAIALSIGEPKHATPDVIKAALLDHLDTGLATYPSTRGLDALRQGIATWLSRRYGLSDGQLDPSRQVLPVSGTREALFSFAQAVIDRTRPATVLMPNPFYQIYEGAALLAGAMPRYLACIPENGYLPDFDAIPESEWDACQLLYLCSPGNPSGAVLPIDRLQQVIALAERHDFVIAADECYAEIYLDESRPPPGLLQACAAMGNDDFRRCVVFHSLSKRSNAPGLRSGFVAGDAQILSRFLRYRTYHGCAMPLHHQMASLAAWRDEAHVEQNRRKYREKFDAVLELLNGHLDTSRPEAGFYLWARTPIDDESFARGLYAAQNVTVLPGSYLSRPINDSSPGDNHVRMALVAERAECVEAAERIVEYIKNI